MSSYLKKLEYLEDAILRQVSLENIKAWEKTPDLGLPLLSAVGEVLLVARSFDTKTENERVVQVLSRLAEILEALYMWDTVSVDHRTAFENLDADVKYLVRASTIQAREMFEGPASFGTELKQALILCLGGGAYAASNYRYLLSVALMLFVRGDDCINADRAERSLYPIQVKA